MLLLWVLNHLLIERGNRRDSLVVTFAINYYHTNSLHLAIRVHTTGASQPLLHETSMPLFKPALIVCNQRVVTNVRLFPTAVLVLCHSLVLNHFLTEMESHRTDSHRFAASYHMRPRT